MPYKSIAKEVVILAVISLATAFGVNWVSPKGIAFVGQWDTAQGVITAKAKNDMVAHELELDDIIMVKNIYDHQQAIFVDARSQEDFREGHIRGAVSLPIGEFESRIDHFKASYPLSQYIVAYCSGRECDDSHELAQRLFEHGYADVSVFIDGYPAWMAEGFPIE